MSRFAVLLLLLASLLTSCSTATPTAQIPLSPTPFPPQPTQAPPATPANGSLFKAGLNYSDTSGDMAISFLDVVGFQARVDEESETLDVILHLRDIPETATRGQVTNLLEYVWSVFVFLDPSKASPDQIPGDYYFVLNTSIQDPVSKSITPIPGTPVSVPVYQLFDLTNLYRANGVTISQPKIDINPDLNTLTISGHVPGIKSNAVFSFATQYFDGTTDRPDNYAAPELTNASTQLPDATQASEPTPVASEDPARLLPAGTIHAYPGPEHYAGDMLTFEIKNDIGIGDGTLEVSMSLDSQAPRKVFATSSWNGLLIPDALDTTDLSGEHTVQFRTADGLLNETYPFKVLPASQRPANEAHASWLVKETDCCIFHYISETAAARDIDFISEHFQKGAGEFTTITGDKIDPKLNVYIIDRLWGNGGFGSPGQLLICYTDRYFGPTLNGEGLEILARHEFTHATNVGVSGKGDGISLSSEGLAVYIAGGHYKPEPLAERAAALYDLGYYVPVEQSGNIHQHELAYLYPAAVLTYITETYGAGVIWKFLDADDNPNDGQPGSLRYAIESTFGIPVQEFDQGFKAWLEGHEPGEQLIDLRLTIELQDLRRQYQDTYSPAPNFLLAETPSEVTHPEYLPIVIREAHAPANIAVELMIADSQRALLEGDYPRVEQLDKVLAKTISTGLLDDSLAKEYLDIVLAAAAQGFEIVNLKIEGGHASARVTAAAPVLADLKLEKVQGHWQIQP